MVRQGRRASLRLRPATRGGDARTAQVKATLHWSPRPMPCPPKCGCNDRLFTKENPDEADEGLDFLANLSPNSLELLSGCWVEPEPGWARAGAIYQFERQATSAWIPTAPVENCVQSRKSC